MAIQEGHTAPDIQLLDEAAQPFQLSAHKGKDVVVYFYPKADTPGCTKEACEFRDAQKAFTRKNAAIVGISPDKPAAHAKFAEKYSLPYTFVADPDHAIAEAYGVWKEKSMYGRKYMGIERTTFVIGPDGRVVEVLRKVKPARHDELVLGALEAAA